MTNSRDHLVLGIAFVAALLLHVAALPFVGAAVGDDPDQSEVDLILEEFSTDTFFFAGQQPSIDHRWRMDSENQPSLYRFDSEVFLSRDNVIDEKDSRLDHIESCSFPADNKSSAGKYATQESLPEDADGPYWLIGRLTLLQINLEQDRSNNTRTVPIYIDGPQTPTLTIDHFVSPERALPGGTIAIHYQVTNTGEGWANTKTGKDTLGTANWTDRIYLSEDDRLDEADLPLRSFDRTAPLGPADRYRHERVALPIPSGLKGKAYLIIAADADQQLDQPSFTEGLVVKPIELVDTTAPDLVVAGIEKIERLVIGRPSQVTFEIANLGNAATAMSWFDGVYLSPEPVLDSRAIPLDLIDSGQSLAPRGRYQTNLPVTVPDTVEPGEYFLVVRADASGSVDEPGFEDNNTLAIPVTVMTQEQADAEIQLGAPDRPERLVVQWIEHDRVEEHIARLSRTVQPALQDKAEPTPNAPLNLFPEPPSIAQQPGNPAGNPANPNQKPDPESGEQARPNPSAPDASQTNQAPKPKDPSAPLTQRVEGLPGTTGNLPQQRPGIEKPLPPTPPTPSDPTPGTNGKPSSLPGDTKVDSPVDPDAPDKPSETDSQTPSTLETPTDATNPDKSPSNQPSEQLKPVETKEPNENKEIDKPVETPSEGDADTSSKEETTTPKPSEDKEQNPDGQPDQPSETSKEQTPTSAPKDPSEAPPTNNRKVEVKLQPGKVLVGEGIKVTTKLPTLPGTGAKRLSLPRNAKVSVTFDNKGKVHEAKVTRSTTYKEWDAAIEASLYRWTAEGNAVDEATPYITIQWDYILNELIGDDE